MKSQVLHAVWCNISGEAAGEISTSSLLGVKGLMKEKQTSILAAHSERTKKRTPQNNLISVYNNECDFFPIITMRRQANIK